MGNKFRCCKRKKDPTHQINEQEKSNLESQTHYTLEEIKDMCETFMSEYPSGKLTMEDLLTLYGNCYPRGNPAAFGQLMFQTFDSNKDGVLDVREVIIGLSVFTRGNLEEKLRWIFTAYDVNDSGYINKQEMLNIYEIVHKFDPSISMSPVERTESVFEQMDADKDGKISQDEFVRAACLDKSIVYPIPV